MPDAPSWTNRDLDEWALQTFGTDLWKLSVLEELSRFSTHERADELTEDERWELLDIYEHIPSDFWWLWRVRAHDLGVPGLAGSDPAIAQRHALDAIHERLEQDPLGPAERAMLESERESLRERTGESSVPSAFQTATAEDVWRSLSLETKTMVRTSVERGTPLPVPPEHDEEEALAAEPGFAFGAGSGLVPGESKANRDAQTRGRVRDMLASPLGWLLGAAFGVAALIVIIALVSSGGSSDETAEPASSGEESGASENAASGDPGVDDSGARDAGADASQTPPAGDPKSDASDTPSDRAAPSETEPFAVGVDATADWHPDCDLNVAPQDLARNDPATDIVGYEVSDLTETASIEIALNASGREYFDSDPFSAAYEVRIGTPDRVAVAGVIYHNGVEQNLIEWDDGTPIDGAIIDVRWVTGNPVIDLSGIPVLDGDEIYFFSHTRPVEGGGYSCDVAGPVLVGQR